MSEERQLLPSPQQAIPALAPFFAPLPIPFIRHLFAGYHGSRVPTLSILDTFYQQFSITRDNIYVYMEPYVQGYLSDEEKKQFASPLYQPSRTLNKKKQEKERGNEDEQLSSLWLRKFLSKQMQFALQIENKTPTLLSSQTLTDYRKKHALHYIEHDIPDFDSAAALAIIFTLHKKERDHVPALTTTEPHYWVWIRRRPEEYWQPCSFPLPNLPKSTPIVSHWSGNAWREPWLLITGQNGNIGATRFAGTTNQGQWLVSMDELAIWDPQYIAYIRAKFKNADQNTELIKDVANIVLRGMAESLLSFIHLPSVTPMFIEEHS